MKKVLIVIALLTMTAVLHAQEFKFDEVTYSPEATTFKLFAPSTAKKVCVRLYADGQAKRALKTVKMQPAGQERRSMSSRWRERTGRAVDQSEWRRRRSERRAA